MAPYHIDAQESAFFAKQLEYVKSKNYDVPSGELKAFSLIPISQEADEAANEITYRQYSKVGKAKIIADYGKDFPKADIFGEEKTIPVIAWGASYGYNTQEIRSAFKARIALDRKRAAAARRAIDESINNQAFFSDPVHKTFGLLDHPDVTTAVLPNDGTGTTTAWFDKDCDKILRDLRILIDAITVPTNNVWVPDTILLPLNVYNHIANLRLGDNTTSLLTYILTNNPYIKRIDWLTELKTRAVCGAFSTTTLSLEIPQAFYQSDPQLQAFEYTVYCSARCAGTIIYHPAAFAYAEVA
jgi:hypothetical protein